MPEEIIETEEITETAAGTENGAGTATETAAETDVETDTEAGTVETVIIVPVIEDSLSAISRQLDRMYVLGFVILIVLFIMCLFTVIRRSD